jgi:hypothetical protein
MKKYKLNIISEQITVKYYMETNITIYWTASFTSISTTSLHQDLHTILQASGAKIAIYRTDTSVSNTGAENNGKYFMSDKCVQEFLWLSR